MNDDFLTALEIVMKAEVGPNFDPKDPEIIAGLCDTRIQKQKVGYTNIPSDSGGETKFGVAKGSHPNLDIKSLTYAQACEIYRNEYWNMNHCDKLPFPLNVIHFDGGVNMGSSRATKFIQQAVGANPVDGSFGPGTMRTALAADPFAAALAIIDLRDAFYKNLAAKVPKNAMFLKGWLNRDQSLREWIYHAKSNVQA
jgi:lysozyme family protein